MGAHKFQHDCNSKNEIFAAKKRTNVYYFFAAVTGVPSNTGNSNELFIPQSFKTVAAERLFGSGCTGHTGVVGPVPA